jgi:hypothetical protein
MWIPPGARDPEFVRQHTPTFGYVNRYRMACGQQQKTAFWLPLHPSEGFRVASRVE